MLEACPRLRSGWPIVVLTMPAAGGQDPTGAPLAAGGSSGAASQSVTGGQSMAGGGASGSAAGAHPRGGAGAARAGESGAGGSALGSTEGPRSDSTDRRIVDYLQIDSERAEAPIFGSLSVGFGKYQNTGAFLVHIDELAFDGERIGCNN